MQQLIENIRLIIKSYILFPLMWIITLSTVNLVAPTVLLLFKQYFKSEEIFELFLTEVITTTYILITAYYYLLKNYKILFKIKNIRKVEKVLRTIYICVASVLVISLSFSIYIIVSPYKYYLRFTIYLLIITIVALLYNAIINNEEFSSYLNYYEDLKVSSSENFKVMSNRLLSKEKDICENVIISRYYLNYYPNHKDKVNVKSLSKLLNKNYNQVCKLLNNLIDIDKSHYISSNIVDYISNNADIENKLILFIQNNTLKYDINLPNYPRRSGYSNSEDYYRAKKDYKAYKRSYLIKINLLNDHFNIPLALNDEMVNYINKVKRKVYADKMYNSLSDIINLSNANLYEIVKLYLEIYRQESLSNIYLSIFSDVVHVEVKSILKIISQIENDLERKQNQYKVESKLFGRSGIKVFDEIDQLSGFQFEDYLHELFKELNCQTVKLPYSNDYGADLIVHFRNKKLIVQAKRYNENNKVSLNAVQEVVAAKKYYKGELAIVITTSTYSKSTIELAKSNNVCLIDRLLLLKIINDKSYFTQLINRYLHMN